jgi:hypothetical protein
VIATECYPDTYLIKQVFGVGNKKINHQGNKGKVVNYTVNNPGSMGMIDEDPDSHQPKILTQFKIVSTCGDLTFMEVKNGSYLIQISPRLEDWFYKRAHIHRIDPKDYDLPRDPNDLHSIPHYEKKSGFLKFLNILTNQDEEIIYLKCWIREHIEV